jgi:hypothetical protein
MPPVGFEPTISILEWAKTVRVLDRADTAIGNKRNNALKPSKISLLIPERLHRCRSRHRMKIEHNVSHMRNIAT